MIGKHETIILQKDFELRTLDPPPLFVPIAGIIV
jgi:hypothetical protein